MPDSPETPYTARVANYVSRLIAGDFDGKTKLEISDILDVDRKTLWLWNKTLDWAYITAEKRKMYAHEILEIDLSMIREGKKGNVPAAELAYRRFDGYVPASALINLNTPDDELKAEAAKIKAELAGNLGGVTEPSEVRPDMPGVGETPAP